MTKTVSYSQYILWKKCPLNWKLSYPDNLRSREETIHTIFGTAMHQTIQTWITALSDGKQLLLSDIYEVYIGCLTKEFESHIQYNEDNSIKSFPCDRPTLELFYTQGEELLEELYKDSSIFFPTTKWKLLGIEVPLEQQLKGDLTFKAYLDIVLKDELTGRIKILDIKTSTRGWNKFAKADEDKIDQVLLYKNFYSKQFGIMLDYVSVEFLILSREKIKNRIDQFVPKNTKKQIQDTNDKFMEFVNTCFDDTGSYTLDSIKATPSEKSCKFCDFRNKPDLCNKSYYKGK